MYYLIITGMRHNYLEECDKITFKILPHGASGVPTRRPTSSDPEGEKHNDRLPAAETRPAPRDR
jgi:hypothetical protein